MTDIRSSVSSLVEVPINQEAGKNGQTFEDENVSAQPQNKPQHHLTRQEISNYFKSRFTTLFPTRETLKEARQKYPLNPFPAVRLLNWQQTQFFLLGVCAWTWDALDFFSVSLNMAAIAKDLNTSVKDISHAITLVLLLRVIGAVIFGYAGDRFGRKYPYCITMVLIIIVQLSQGFVKTYSAFLGVRAIFGIIMGSIYGVASATALENAPIEARSILSGMFQQGYALGYLLGVVFVRAIVDTSPYGWRAIFWFSAGPPVLFIVWRLLLPESPAFIRLKEEQKRVAKRTNDGKSIFWQNARTAVRCHWITMIYLVILMAMFNFSSHGTQDLFPTMLTTQYSYSENASTVTNSVANLGAIAGGIIVAHASSFIGRRLAIAICIVIAGGLLYPWGFTSDPKGLNAAVFFLQFCIQGLWGCCPIYLIEMCPMEFRAFLTGVAYQMGNMISSASSTIEATIGEKFPIEGKPEGVYDYGKVMCIFMGCVLGVFLVVIILGPENKGGEIMLNGEVSSARGSVAMERLSGDLESNANDVVEIEEEFKPQVEHKE